MRSYPDWMKRHPDWIAKVERGERNLAKDAKRRDPGETCERCGENQHEGEWVQGLPATHDSPVELDWVCRQCCETSEDERCATC